jgi:hypothetical protein
MIFGDYGWLKVMWGALLRTVHPTSTESLAHSTLTYGIIDLNWY